jgi:hypothetical protein
VQMLSTHPMRPNGQRAEVTGHHIVSDSTEAVAPIGVDWTAVKALL